ncbi:hypothetical protein SYNPS1DRAFT_32753 [Syncephalis pseudoplumigaleata]|uniref:Transcriptional adapter 2 n=1 Tax=Syncephalis pseudoplumigaleata TaxID=1712513 RepID=A0A4P9Z327_9FUNG|nr:hypothetical protein SYNPS1DRAFT_32753 [Syncephalis pseudoplumigaleata]|eukprot:RKP26372.1 hypothetical protein SYNPS1DRAFT_32753 [Syncephalis pseudoplumigaleata]
MSFQRRTRLCDACQANITNAVRIKCAVCDDAEYCVDCFAQGKEAGGTHKATHDYRVMDRLSFPILESDWGADEELLFVEGLKTCGMGNWAAIADHIGTKTKEQCESHYLNAFINSPNWPLPVPYDADMAADVAGGYGHVGRCEQRHQKTHTSSSQPSNHEIVGYMPGRLEFEQECENEAENSVKDLVFYEDDADEDMELKITLLNIYNAKLDRREARKKLILERGLLEYRKNQANERKLAKEDRDLLNRCKVFAKMMTKEDFDEFVEGLINERRIRRRIAELQEYRQNGIRTESAAAAYERQKEQRATPPPSASQKGMGRKPANPLDITEADGIHLLSIDEQELCSALRILPKPYLVIKETILNEYTRRGTLRRRQARELIKIDVNKTSRIYDFFMKMGWIRAPVKDP